MNSGTRENGDTTILLTGIGGFLGGHIARQLLARGYFVRGSVRRISQREEITGQICPDTPADATRVSFVEADLRADAGWDAAVAGCRYVIHTASPFPAGLPKDEDDLIQPARDCALRVLRAAQRAMALPLVERSRLVSGARAYIGAAARRVANEAVQMHGGVGVTEELEISHHFRRVMVINALFGGREAHLRRFTDLSLASAAQAVVAPC